MLNGIYDLYNKIHHITPKSIKKAVHDMIEKEHELHAETVESKEVMDNHDPIKLAKKIQALEKEMNKKAQNMEFEQAAVIRDQILALKSYFIE